VWLILIWAHTRFESLTNGHRSETRDRSLTTRRGPAGLTRRRRPDTNMRDHSRLLSLSLSFPIKGDIGRSFPLFTHFPQRRGEPPTPLPPASRHLAIPFTWLILISLRSFCPMFHGHRSTPLSAITDHVSDLHPLPVSAFPTASHHRQAPPPCF
jgi:hypothetical protein